MYDLDLPTLDVRSAAVFLDDLERICGSESQPHRMVHAQHQVLKFRVPSAASVAIASGASIKVGAGDGSGTSPQP